METTKMPTSREIYVEADGKRLAAVQQYRVRGSRTAKSVDAIGSNTAIALVTGKTSYELELKKVMLSREYDPVDVYELSNFVVMIVKPDRRIVYSGCEWKEIEETLELGEPCLERMVLSASKRMVLEAQA